MQMIGRGTSRESIGKIFDSVTFIVFNYDRCLEQFLLHALQRLYAIPTMTRLKFSTGFVSFIRMESSPSFKPEPGARRHVRR
jgi:hypothetical protein